MYSGNRISGIDLRFEQVCEGSNAALHGAVRWDAPPDLTALPPATLTEPGSWHAPAASIPATGNYLYFESEPGDRAGGGFTHLLTPLNTFVEMQEVDTALRLQAYGPTEAGGTFQMPYGRVPVQKGIYPGLKRFTYKSIQTRTPATPASGSFGWGSGNFYRVVGACFEITGWVAVDDVVYDDGVPVSIDLRFEQACISAPGTLKGQIHWVMSETPALPGPMTPAPAQLWRPAAGSTPATGNYVHIESDPGEPLGVGIGADYTQANAVIRVMPAAAGVEVKVAGDVGWAVYMQPIAGLAMQVGYYGGSLGEMNFGRSPKGSFAIHRSVPYEGCDSAQTGFVVDNLRYDGETIAALDLRFEQRCEGSINSALRGAIHWTNDDPTTPRGPVDPPPDLWRPPAGATADSGTYVYLQSDEGDYMGAGMTSTSAAPTSQIDVNTRADGVVVVSVTYTGDEISALDLRFEQHCDDVVPALRGRVRWEP